MSGSSVAESKVGAIVKTLSSLEDEIDSINSRVSDMQRGVAAKSQSELAGLRKRTQEMASGEAERIIAGARSKAEAEAADIAAKAESGLSEIRSKIDANFDGAVDIVVSTVLGADRSS